MSLIPKFAVTGLAVALLGTAAGLAHADGHEQARQLLQRSEPRTDVKPLLSATRVAASDPHEQARHLIEGTSATVQVNSPQYAAVALTAEPDKAVDAQTKARNLLDRKLVAKAQRTRVSRASAVEAGSKERSGNAD